MSSLKKFRFNRYNDYIKKKYQHRVQKITVDAGFTCPNRDGSLGDSGCTYCNNESFAPIHLKGLSITEQINHGIATSKRRYKNINKYLVYFQPFSNTYAPLEKLRRLYMEALSHPEVIGLCIGTRPDCIDQEKMEFLRFLSGNYDITIEYGLESISDITLKKIKRGHDYQTFLKAVELTSQKEIQICVHVIIGFPWEKEEQWIQTAKELSKLPIHFLKIHQLHLVRGTVMGNQYLKSPFPLPSMQQYLNIILNFLEYLRPDIVIQRLYGDAPSHLLLSPDWNLELSQFTDHLNNLMIEKNTYQGKLYRPNHEQSS